MAADSRLRHAEILRGCDGRTRSHHGAQDFKLVEDS